MEAMLLLVVLVAVLVFILVRGFTQSRAAIIKDPTISFLDLSGGEFAELLRGDETALGPLFKSATESNLTPPRCNVLFLYCRLGAGGQIPGSNRGLRELIRDSGASVVVVASENTGEQYHAAAKETGYGRANLVMTLERKGPAFAHFFYQLFSLMKRGKSMPMAWVKLAPQVPHPQNSKGPEIFFFCEAGQIKFR